MRPNPSYVTFAPNRLYERMQDRRSFPWFALSISVGLILLMIFGVV